MNITEAVWHMYKQILLENVYMANTCLDKGANSDKYKSLTLYELPLFEKRHLKIVHITNETTENDDDDDIDDDDDNDVALRDDIPKAIE